MSHNKYYKDEYFESLTESDPFGGISLCSHYREADSANTNNKKPTTQYNVNGSAVNKGGTYLLRELEQSGLFKDDSGFLFINAGGLLFVNEINWSGGATLYTNYFPKSGKECNYDEFVRDLGLDTEKNNWVYVSSKNGQLFEKAYKQITTNVKYGGGYQKDNNAVRASLDKMSTYLKSGKKVHWAYVTGDKVSSSVKFKGTPVLNSISNAIGAKAQITW